MSDAAAAIGEVIRLRMAERRISQTHMARIIGVSQPQFSKRLTGRLPFDMRELELIAHALDEPIERLVADMAARGSASAVQR